jgi:hypothetical protein
MSAEALPADPRLIELLAFQLFAFETARRLVTDYTVVNKTSSAAASEWRSKADERLFFTEAAEVMVRALAHDGVAVRTAAQRALVKATTDLATVPATLAYTPGNLLAQHTPASDDDASAS